MFPEGFAVPVKPFVEVQDQVAEAAAGGEAPAALIFQEFLALSLRQGAVGFIKRPIP